MSKINLSPEEEKAFQKYLEERDNKKEEMKDEKNIILYNDDVNTFDHVIKCLIHYCNHEPLQAEQCALLVHYKGKCQIKGGEYIKLKPLCEKLLSQGLSAKIE